jgi:glycosyltransferase involved in cell wall biosynthesis
MPLAVEALDLSGYDLVISSSHALAKGVITGPDQVHICYCYSPMRYAWDLQHQYLAESGMTSGLKGMIARLTLHYMRLWDLRTANGVDQFVGISRYIVRRIRKVYRRDALVIYPPVDVQGFELREAKEDFYLTAGRLVPYKKVSAIVAAFARMPEKRLVVIGTGPLYDSLRAAATPNVELPGYQSFAVLRDHMQRARAFVFAAEEDFGITVLEAQACGTPVICYDRGGATETIIDGETGVFFSEQTAESVEDAIGRFESLPPFSPFLARKNAERFSQERFRSEFLEIVNRSLQDRAD